MQKIQKNTGTQKIYNEDMRVTPTQHGVTEIAINRKSTGSAFHPVCLLKGNDCFWYIH
jgi:hypothetical protein